MFPRETHTAVKKEITFGKKKIKIRKNFKVNGNKNSTYPK
jgi:hypothetical protein